MKYRLVDNSSNNINSLIKTILNNRGVKEELHGSFIKPLYSNSGIELDNLKEAKECLLKHINTNDEIAILVDCDVDGFTSAACLYMYLKEKVPTINLYYVLHQGKAHGLSDKHISFKETTKLIIVPDAGSNDYEEHKMFYDKGVDIIVLDHHECNEYSEHAIVVNNQMSQGYLNKDLSGVGVVYRFLQELDSVFPTEDDDWGDVINADYYLDLVAIGVVADNMMMNNLENRWICYKGLLNIHNEFILALIKKASYQLGGKTQLSPINVAFSIAPKINAVIRKADAQENDIMFRALIGEQRQVEYAKRGGDVELISFQEYVANKCTNVHQQSSSSTKKMFEKVVEEVDYGWDELGKIGFINANENVDTNYTGLVAIKLAEHYMRPIVLYHIRPDMEGNKICQGSCRNCSNSFIDSFKDVLEETGKFNMLSGHANAFGFEFDYDKLSEISKMLEEKFSDIAIEQVYKVDFIIDDINDIDYSVFKTLDSMQFMWGKGFEEPIFVIKNIPLEYNKIFFNRDKKTMKSEHDSISIIKFGVDDKDCVAKLVDSFDYYDDYIYVDAICRLGVNEWNGIRRNQINVIEWEVSKNV